MTDPQWMPYSVKLTPSAWELLGRDLEEVVLRHPLTWPGWRAGQLDWRAIRHKPEEDPEQGDFLDSWGCVWRTTMRGFVGAAIAHPIRTLEDIDTLDAPDPSVRGHMRPVDWTEVRAALPRDGRAVASGGPEHGFHLLRMEYLCGLENLLVWMHDDPEAIRRLAAKVHGFNRELVRRWLELGVEMVTLGEDLGTQHGSLLGPLGFAKWVEPYYRDLVGMAVRAGALVYLHSDGDIMDIADGLLGVGLHVLNPQDVVNGVEQLARAFKGRVCFDLDFDRQHALPFGTRKEIEELVAMEVRTLGSPRGGLSVKAEVRGPVPPENIDALAGALELAARYWFEERA